MIEINLVVVPHEYCKISSKFKRKFKIVDLPQLILPIIGIANLLMLSNF